MWTLSYGSCQAFHQRPRVWNAKVGLTLSLILPSRLQVKAAMKRLQEIATEVHASTVAGPGKRLDAQGGASEPAHATTAADGEAVEGLRL